MPPVYMLTVKLRVSSVCMLTVKVIVICVHVDCKVEGVFCVHVDSKVKSVLCVHVDSKVMGLQRCGFSDKRLPGLFFLFSFFFGTTNKGIHIFLFLFFLCYVDEAVSRACFTLDSGHRPLFAMQNHRDSMHIAESQGLYAHCRITGALIYAHCRITRLCTWQDHGTAHGRNMDSAHCKITGTLQIAKSQGLYAHGRITDCVHMAESQGLCTWQSHRDSMHIAES